jgi:UDP-glucose 4-epimerase
MHVLLTGASGRIGSYTLQYLLRNGHRVTSVDVAPLPPPVLSSLPPAQVDNHHIVDLASHTAVDTLFESATSKTGKLDGIIHFGSIPDPKGKDWRFVHNNNVAGSYNIIYTAMKMGIKRISQASSVNATGLSYTRPGKQIFDEFPITEKESYRAVSLL